MSDLVDDVDLADDERYSDKEFQFTVTVKCQRQAQAEHVMRERIFHDEEYGFNYTVDFRNFDWKREAIVQKIKDARACRLAGDQRTELAMYRELGQLLEADVTGPIQE